MAILVLTAAICGFSILLLGPLLLRFLLSFQIRGPLLSVLDPFFGYVKHITPSN